MESKENAVITLDAARETEESTFGSSLWSDVGLTDMINRKHSLRKSNELSSKNQFSILKNDISKKSQITHDISDKDSAKEFSPYKSPTVLSFDAYGNLTSSDDPDAPYTHEVPSLAEFDYILDSFEGKLQKEVTSLKMGKNGTIKKPKLKKIKHNSGTNETNPISDKELKQAFKKDYDTSGSATSRYGRTRKQKAQDGFLFGTINFNALRKITSSSPKKSRHSSASEGKSDSESSTIGDLQHSISSHFETLSDKITGYSSEEEFANIKKDTKVNSKKARSLSVNKPSKQMAKRPSREGNKKGSNKIGKKRKKLISLNADEKCPTKMKKVSSTAELKSDSQESIDSPSDKTNSDKIDSELSDSISESMDAKKESTEIEEHKYNCNDMKDNTKELGSIEEDVSIIKSSLAGFNTLEDKKESPLISPSADSETEKCKTSEQVEDMKKSEDKGVFEKKKLKRDFCQKTEMALESAETEPKIIEMETLNEEVKTEEALKTKSGRPVKKPVLIDLAAEEVKRRKELSQRQKQAVTVIEEHFIDPSSTDADQKKKKTVADPPCSYFLGDLLWVTMKGNPLWPGMITYPKDETVYTKIATSRGPHAANSSNSLSRLYHVEFFYDNHQTMWVSEKAVFEYNGFPKLISLMEEVKETARTNKNSPKLLTPEARIILKTHMKMQLFLQRDINIHSKTAQWYEAVKEADSILGLERDKRVKQFVISPKEQMKRKRSLTKSKTEKVTPKRRLSSKDETGSIKSKSSDDFSGFDDDLISGKRKREILVDLQKSKRIKAEKHKGGDFYVYLQKHLDSTMDDMNLNKKKAGEFLRKKWKKLTPLQKSRYKSKLSNYDASTTSSYDTDDSSSELSSVASSRSKKSSVYGDDVAESSSRGVYRVPKNEKVCHFCETATVKSGTDMVKCRGVCAAQFHIHCVGLDTVPEGEFKCEACLSGSHKCFICKSGDGRKDRCSVQSCGKFYHPECVRTWPQVSKARQIEKLVCPRHVCHMCAANADDMNDPAARTPPFTRCLRCPTTYHTGETCVAAGTDEISQHYHICTKHMKLPKNSNYHVNVNWCFCCSKRNGSHNPANQAKGGSLLLCDQCPAAFHAECLSIDAPEGSFICEDCENGKFPVYGDIVWAKLGIYRWWPGEVLHQRFIPDNIENLNHVQGMFCVHFFGSDDYYWMTRGRTFHYQEGDQGSKSSSSKSLEEQFKKALNEAVVAYRKEKEKREAQERNRSLKGNLKPPPYVRIDTNKPVGSVRLGKLDPSAITRCDCDPYSENPCGSDDKCINRMLMVECIREVCPGKDRCNNQRFQRRQYPHVFPFKTTGRGFGLKTKEFIKKGEFVIEYVGELIDEGEFRRRIEEMHEYKEENYYFLTVETDRLIDAGPKGNLARFMNHSCRPNCETQKWTVGADTRVGLFALEDIAEGSELTFNYNLQCVGTDKKRCNCGSTNCSGFIGTKPDPLTVKKKCENGVLKKKKKGRKKKNDKDWENECFRCGNAGDLILCDVTNCPKGYHLACLELKGLPKGKWLCPWHHCDECGNRAGNRCIMCPNSYCKAHSNDKFHSTPGLENVCLDHGKDEVQANRPLSRSRTRAKSSPSPAEETVQKYPPEKLPRLRTLPQLLQG